MKKDIQDLADEYPVEKQESMAAVVSALRRRRQGQFMEEPKYEESLLETLVTTLPAKDSWEAEFFLGVMVLGSGAFSATSSFE